MRVPEVEVRNLPALDADNTEEVPRRHLRRQHRELGNFGKLIRAAPPDVTDAREDRSLSAEPVTYHMHQHRAGNGTARSSRLRELDREFLEGADPAQYRQASLRGYAELSRNRAGDRRLPASEHGHRQLHSGKLHAEADRSLDGDRRGDGRQRLYRPPHGGYQPLTGVDFLKRLMTAWSGMRRPGRFRRHALRRKMVLDRRYRYPSKVHVRDHYSVILNGRYRCQAVGAGRYHAREPK